MLKQSKGCQGYVQRYLGSKANEVKAVKHGSVWHIVMAVGDNEYAAWAKAANQLMNTRRYDYRDGILMGLGIAVESITDEIAQVKRQTRGKREQS